MSMPYDEDERDEFANCFLIVRTTYGLMTGGDEVDENSRQVFA